MQDAGRANKEGFFVGARLTEAREARNVTQRELAENLNVSYPTVSRWERGDRAPEPEKQNLLAEILGVSPSYFLRPVADHGSSPIFFRSLASTTLRARTREKARMRWLQHISLALQNRLDLPTVDVPAPVKSNEYAKLSDADLESIAISVRHHWGLGEGPITQMALLAENAGVIIGIDEVGSTKIDGQANWSSVDSRPYILLARDKYTAYRRQMDIGHELAHLILHRDVSGTQLVNDFELIEHQAKYFAGAFLLPARSFVAEIPSLSLEGFKSLKRKWMVAIGAMIMRAEQLCVLTEEGARRLWKYKAARGWAQKEPFDDPTETPVEEPRLLRRAIELVTAHNVRARRDLLETDLGIGAGDVELLASLQRGFFAEASGQVVRLEPKLRLVVESQGGDIVPFKRS